MKWILFSVFMVFLIFVSCTVSRSGSKTVVEQGIRGSVSAVTGNQMPMKGAPESRPKGMATVVLIYEATHIHQVTKAGAPTLFSGIQTKQVSSVQTDSTGKFSVSLPPGKYSLFVKLDKGLYANLFDQFNQIALFDVEEGKYTTANLIVSLGATY